MGYIQNKTRNWFIVLNIPNSEDKSKLENNIKYLTEKIYDLDYDILENESKLNYYSIIHNGELNEKNVEKEIHAHIILQHPNPVYGTALLKKLKELWQVPENVISLIPCSDIYDNIQYLTHKNNPEKKQFCYDEIITNNQEQLFYYYNHCLFTQEQLKYWVQDLGLELYQIGDLIGADQMRRNCYYINSYIKSYNNNFGKTYKIEKETGEIKEK